MNELLGELPAKAGIGDAVAGSRGKGLARLMGSGSTVAGSRLAGRDNGMAKTQSIARELFRFGRNKIGADQMGEIMAVAPGLSQFA